MKTGIGLFFWLWSTVVFADPFIIQVLDRSMRIDAPEKRVSAISVVIENKSLADQVAKFVLDGKILKFASVKSGKTETIYLENKSASANILFVPLAPAAQEIELRFGVKAYEIPSQE